MYPEVGIQSPWSIFFGTDICDMKKTLRFASTANSWAMIGTRTWSYRTINNTTITKNNSHNNNYKSLYLNSLSVAGCCDSPVIRNFFRFFGENNKFQFPTNSALICLNLLHHFRNGWTLQNQGRLFSTNFVQ